MNKIRAEKHRLIGIQRSKKLGIYHNSKLKFTKYNQNLKNAFYEVLHRKTNHMSMKNIADTNHMSRSTLYKKLNKYKPYLNTKNSTKAFSDWIGGKARHSILKKLQALMPLNYNPNTNYFYELFSGMASLALSVQPKHLILNDSNPLVITCFNEVKKHPRELIKQVKQRINKNSRNYFYQTRTTVNSKSESPLNRVSGLLYLTSTSFNGFIRVNHSGKFNMAWGKGRCNPPNYQAIINDSRYLNQIDLHLFHEDFEDVLFNHKDIKPKAHDFIYLDPPYVKGYKLYGKNIFNLNDLIRLRNLVILLSFQHVYIMVSNYDTPLVREIFMGKPFHINPIQMSNAVNSNGKQRKRKFREVIITNY